MKSLLRSLHVLTMHGSVSYLSIAPFRLIPRRTVTFVTKYIRYQKYNYSHYFIKQINFLLESTSKFVTPLFFFTRGFLTPLNLKELFLICTMENMLRQSRLYKVTSPLSRVAPNKIQ